MASVVLGTLGATVGNAILPGIGGAVFGALGSGLGGLADQKLGIGTHVTGPRLDNLSVQDSRYGAPIPTVYGNARIAGNVIWSTDLIEAQHDSSAGGKGGGSVSETAYTYSLHCAVGICAGPIAGIDTIWADSTVIYQNGVWASGVCDSATIYTGAVGQGPDAFMESILGAGNVPACRGLAYIVFDNLQLANYGNRLPNLTFEIAASAATENPQWLGGVDASVAQRNMGMQSGTMPPLALNDNEVLVGGYGGSGSTLFLTAALYDASEDAPLQISRASCAAFTAGSPVDCSWALAPDGRFVAMYLQTTSSPTHHFVLYDSETQNFGAVYGASLAGSSSIKQIMWLDAQHFVIDDAAGGARGLHLFARSGTGIVDLGFTPLWGAGSASSTTLLYGAQFTPFGDGLIAYVWRASGTALLACAVSLRLGKLTAGEIYTVATLALGSGSGPHARFVQTAAGEYTLCYGTVVDYRLISFEPGGTGAAITRPWQVFTLSRGTGTTNFPLFYGDRLLVVQRYAAESAYCLSEVTLASGSFALALDGVKVGGVTALDYYFHALRLDGTRLLLAAMGGFASDVNQLGIIERNQGGSVAAILADILARAGYDSGDYDVSALDSVMIGGYVLQDIMSARSAIEPLQAYTPFDLIESAGLLKAVPRGGAAAATVAGPEWRAAAEGKPQPAPLTVMRAQEMDLPREVDVDVSDPGRNYETNSQRARRIAGASMAVQKISLPVVCDAATAKQIAETRLFTAWAERELVRLSVSRAWLMLDAGDVVDLGNGDSLRIASFAQSGGLLQIEGFYAFAPGLQSAAIADSGQALAAAGAAIVPGTLYLMDLPLLQSSDDQPGLYIAATGAPGWKSATVMRSGDGVSYATVATLAQAAVAGIAATALADAAAYYMDNANSVTVQVTQGALASCAFADLCNGANAALLGGEIIQFQNAALAGPGCYTLTGLLRGRRGTESAAATHAAGEIFVLLQSGPVQFLPGKQSDRGALYDFRALSPGQNAGDALDYPFTYGLRTLCPFSPVHVTGARAGGDLVLSWVRRARLNAEWVDYIDVPLDEPQELYEADIMNGAAVMRAFTGLTSPTVTYTAAQQAADWPGGIPATFTVTIYQAGALYGNGAPATAVV